MPPRVTLQQVLDRQAFSRVEEHRNAVARIAASLPRQRGPQGHGALNKHEAAGTAIPAASTTQVLRRENNGGCCPHGRT
jgi:hypothetical protein